MGWWIIYVYIYMYIYFCWTKESDRKWRTKWFSHSNIYNFFSAVS